MLHLNHPVFITRDFLILETRTDERVIGWRVKIKFDVDQGQILCVHCCGGLFNYVMYK